MGKFLLNLKKHKKIIGIFSLSTIIFGATGTSISFAVKANETSISRATKLSEEFYENINWNDVESLRKELVSSYEEKLNNDAEYEDLRNDPNHTVSEYVYNFNNFLKYEVLNQKTKNYSPKIVYDHLQEISDEYKLNVLDWEYAINYSQLLIENSEKEINALSNLTTEQKKEINKSTTDKIEISFSEARSNGWTALEFINHFMKLMNSSITSQRNEFVEKAITNNKLLEFLASQHLCANEQVLPNKLQINLEKISLNTDVTNLLPYLFKFNGYPVTEHSIEGYKLGLSVKANEKENAFKRNFIFVFSLIKENSEFFVEAPAQQELKNISISESNEIENKAIFENVFSKAFVEPKQNSMGVEPMAYTDFIAEIKGQETNISFETLVKILNFNIDPCYEQFFCNNSNESETAEVKYRIFGKLKSHDDNEKTCSISIDIQNITENKSFNDIFEDKITIPTFDIQLGLSEEEQWEAIQFISKKLFRVVENSEISQAIFSVYTPELNSSLNKKVDFNIAFLTIECVALLYYSAMAIIQWINVVITFGACLWSAVCYTACVVGTTVSIVFLSIEEKENIGSRNIVEKIRSNDNFSKTYPAWNSKKNENLKDNFFDFADRIYTFYSQFKTFDHDSVQFNKNEFIELCGGENKSIYFASKQIFSFWDEFVNKFLSVDEVSTVFGFALAMDYDPNEDGKYSVSVQRFFESFINTVDVTWIIGQKIFEWFSIAHNFQSIGMFVKTNVFGSILKSFTANSGIASAHGIVWFTDGERALIFLRQGVWQSFLDCCVRGGNGLKESFRVVVDFFASYKYWNTKIPVNSFHEVQVLFNNDPTLTVEIYRNLTTPVYRNIMQTDMVCASLVNSPFLIMFEFVLGIIEMGMAIASMCQ